MSRALLRRVEALEASVYVGQERHGGRVRLMQVQENGEIYYIEVGPGGLRRVGPPAGGRSGRQNRPRRRRYRSNGR